MPGVNVISSVTKYLTRSAERVFKYCSHVNTTAGFLLQRSVNRSPARPTAACLPTERDALQGSRFTLVDRQSR